MDKKFINKQVNVSDIITIAEMVEKHCKYYKDLENSENKQFENSKKQNKSYIQRYVKGNIKYSVQFDNNEVFSKENDLAWFKETILHNARFITSLSIYFSGTEEERRESLNLNFTPSRVFFDSSITNMFENALANMVADFIENLPPRLDSTVKNDTPRRLLPALIISLPLAIIVSMGILLWLKFNHLSAELSRMVTNGFTLTFILFVIAFFGALLIPTKNIELYRQIRIDTKHAGFDAKNFTSIRKNDYTEYKSKCEVAIGYNADMPLVRQRIEANYRRAKLIFKFQLIILVAVIIYFFFA